MVKRKGINVGFIYSELGVHIDGYIATAAHTTVVASTTQEPITGRAADVVAATYFAYEAAVRMLRPGVKVNLEKIIFIFTRKNCILKVIIGFRNYPCYY